MAKIADLPGPTASQAYAALLRGRLASRKLAASADWSVEDVVCSAGPSDPPFEERHACRRIALVGGGTFGCRAPTGSALLTPGSLLLGNPGECFECGHEHATGDRSLSFGYAPTYFERVAADAGVREARFRALRIPALRALAPWTARACAAWARPVSQTACIEWEELAVLLAANAAHLAASSARTARAPRNAERGVSRAVRLIERDPAAALTLHDLASEGALSPYHFLRTFARVTEVTPHRYLLRARVRAAAARLVAGDYAIIDVALDCGFRDVSSFNRTFRAELGASPREFRRRYARAARWPAGLSSAAPTDENARFANRQRARRRRT